VAAHDLTVCSVLSGNRNFECRIHPECKMNFLASPPPVIACALAGTMLADILRDPLYRLDPDRSAHVLLDHVTISNGLDWSPMAPSRNAAPY
jgi:aconitase A